MHKRVTFAPTNLVYSPTSTSPSPSLSFSSLPSSSSPEITTPPPEDEPYAAAPYPPTPYNHQQDIYPEEPPKTVHIHRLLGYHPALEPGISYDLSLAPEMLEEEVDRELFTEPATSPPFTSLIVKHPCFLSDVSIVPTHDGGYVSVFDILITIHRELRRPITAEQYRSISEDGRQRVDRAYFERCSRVPDALREKELLKGIKRIDLFMGHTRFLGLSGTLTGLDVWELNVS